MAETENLTTAQKRGIVALLTERDVRAAARAAKVGERTLARWLTFPAFREALLDAEGAAIDAATRRLLGLQSDAIDTLANTLSDPKAGAAVKLRAAQAILDYLLKMRELRNIESRLIRLEVMIYGDKQAN